ncbi:MAG: hypothetical protein ACOC7R_00350 [Planctomycetota bacterium]
MDFEDARTDRMLYALWLSDTSTPADLAERLGMLLREGGYTVADPFIDGLMRVAAIDLADFIAANSAFERDDDPWLDHCRRRYGVADHPSLTAALRNGGRCTWRNGP